MKRGHDAILHAEQADYLERMIAPRDEVLLAIEERARRDRQPVTDPEVGHFLHVTTRARAPKLIVELGTNLGYGAIVLARAAGPEGRVLTCEVNASLAAEARGYIARAGLTERIEVRETPALTLLASLPVNSIDLAYVDCVKEEYPEYLKLLLPRLTDRGMIIADNILWGGDVARRDIPDGQQPRTDALREFNRQLLGNSGMRAVLLPLGDGVAMAIK